MNEEPELAQRREDLNKARNLFNRHPTPETKEAYKKASSAFNLALYHAGMTTVMSAPEPESEEPEEVVPTIAPEDAEAIDVARRAQNAAYRQMYANPCEETRVKWRAASNAYRRIRRKFDPAFRAKLSASAKKSAAKKI